MARLFSDFDFSGTIGNLTIYRIGNRTYIRTKSSMDRKRFLKDPAFARSREKADLFGKAAQVTKAFYQTLSQEVKQHGLFGKLTAIAYKGLQAGKSTCDIVKELQAYCGIKALEPALAGSVKQQQAGNKREVPMLSKWQVSVAGRLVTRKNSSELYAFFMSKSIKKKCTSSPPDG